MMATKFKLCIGSEMKFSGFGLRGRAKGMYSGGFNYYVYGIKNIIGVTYYEAWGDMVRDNPNLK